MTVTDWLALGTVLIGAIGAIATALLTSRKPRDGDAEKPYRAKPIVIALHDEDRARIDRAARTVEEALDHHGRLVSRSLGEHSETIADQTSALRRAPGGQQD